MKFTCEKYLFLSAVNICSRAVAAKSTIPTLEGLYISAAGETIGVVGYDLKKGIYTTFQAEIEEPGSVVIGSRLLGDITRSLPDGDVTVACDSSGLVKITCGDAEFSIMGIDSEDYPELPTVESRDTITIPGEKLKAMIEQTIFAVSDNEARPIYTGAMFEVSGGELTVISVDGYRMAIRREKLELDDKADRSFIVPGTALSDVEKITTDEDDVHITLGMKHVSFKIGNTTLVTRRLEGEFINYKKAVPQDFYINLTVDCKAFKSSIDRVSLIIDDRTRSPLRCTFGNGSLKLHCATPIGRAEDICPIEGDGRNLEIGFNNRYLLDVLKAVPAEKVKVRLNTGSSPCVIAPVDENDSFLYMILPVRLSESR